MNKKNITSFVDTKWTQTKPTPPLRRREFVVGESSVTEHFTSDEPIDIFEGIFTDHLIDLIVENTVQSMPGRGFVRIS